MLLMLSAMFGSRFPLKVNHIFFGINILINTSARQNCLALVVGLSDYR